MPVLYLISSNTVQRYDRGDPLYKCSDRWDDFYHMRLNPYYGSIKFLRNIPYLAKK